MKRIFTTKILSLFSLVLFFMASGSAFGQSETVIFNEDFSSLTEGGNSSGTGATGPSGTEWTGNANFPTVYKAYSAGGAVKLGTGSLIGSLTSKPLDLSANGGKFKVLVKVKGWTNIEGTIKVTAGSLEPQTITYAAKMADAFEELEVEFTGGLANSTIKIETSAKRAFIDEVKVYYGASTDLSNDANLSDLQVNGSTVDGFSSDILSYYVSLPAGTTTLPVVTATTNHSKATATVSNVTVPGYTNINVVAENGTTEKEYRIYFTQEPAPSEKGSKENPYTLTDVLDIQHPAGVTTKYWIKGFIVGCVDGNMTKIQASDFSVVSNIVLGTTPDVDVVIDVNSVIPVQLLTEAAMPGVRSALNLKDNPSNYKKEVLVYGTLETYFLVPALKNTAEFDFLVSINPEQAAVQPKVFAAKNEIHVIVDETTPQISVYDAMGRLVVTKKSNEGLNVIPLTAGNLYVVKVGTQSVKVATN